MHLLISTNGNLSLKEADDMKRFSIINQSEVNLTTLQGFTAADEENHYWVDVDQVIALSSKSDDPQWVEAFWNMLTMVEKYGYSDLKNRRIKAHLET